MKKSAIAIILIIFFTYSYGQKFSGGFAISPILSWMKPPITKNIETESMKFGFGFGVTGDYNLTDNFAFSSGININNFGGKLKFLDSIPEFTVDKGSYDSSYVFSPNAVVLYKMQYVEIPFSLKGKTNEIGYMTYFMKAGLNPMIRWQTKADVTQGNISNESIMKEVSGFAVGYSLAGGFEYSFGGNTKLLVELIYLNGLTDITKTKTYSASSKQENNEKIILNYIALKCGILF
ncbi:MAG: porin family protein [Bacteroidota bacterium]